MIQQNSNLHKVRYRIGIFVKSWSEIPTIINGLGSAISIFKYREYTVNLLLL